MVFNSPHSGRNYPAEFVAASRLAPLDLRRSEDSFVDELFAFAPALGCPLLRANFPRAYIDVNREPFELDPGMFDEPLPAHVNTSTLRIASGLGTIARQVSEKALIYRQKLTWAEAEKRIERYYFPYHAALEGLVLGTRDQFGLALLIDCHSMPSSATGQTRFSTRRPDIVLGNRFGQSCDPGFIKQLESLLRHEGLRVARNKPYAGGFITAKYGRPAHGLHAIQIEINRALYMNEATMERTSGLGRLAAILERTFASLIVDVNGKIANHRLAAE